MCLKSKTNRYVRSHLRKGTRRRIGAALVELAIAIPLMLTVGLGCLDLARVFFDQATLSFAVRQGVMCGCKGNFDDAGIDQFEDKIRAEIIREMETLNEFDESLLDVEITVQREGDESFLLIVNAVYPFQSIFANQFIDLELDLGHRMAARRFQ